MRGVPYASAATAWAPPIRNTRVAPATRAAASTAGCIPPSNDGGDTITISLTPATDAGVMFMRTLEG